MRAINIINIGPDFRLNLSETPMPVPGPGDVCIKVFYAGVNRPDLLQALGKYTLPPYVSQIPGLEVSGIIEASEHPDFKIGDRVCALTNGGAYADYVCVPASQTFQLPGHLNFIDAATLPEALFTVWHNMIQLGRFEKDSRILIHGGSSGIGTIAIQIAKALHAPFIATTVRNTKSAELCLTLGAHQVIDTSQDDFEKQLSQPVDIVLDMMGGDYFEKNLDVLAPNGRHISIAALRGFSPTLPIRTLMQKNLTVTASTLRPKSRAEKAAIAHDLRTVIWPFVANGQIRPVIAKTLPLKDAEMALKMLQNGGILGKIALLVNDPA